MRSASGLSWEACGHSMNWLTLFWEEIFAENTFLLQLFLRDLTDHITAQTHPLTGSVFRQHKVTCTKDAEHMAQSHHGPMCPMSDPTVQDGGLSPESAP